MGAFHWMTENKSRVVLVTVPLMLITLWISSRIPGSVGDNRRAAFGVALFEQPKAVTPEATGFNIQIAKKNPFQESISIPANRPVTVESVWPAAGKNHQQVVEIVLTPVPEASPRLDSKQHAGVKVFLAYNSIVGVPDPEMRFPAPQELVFPCDAGAYEMRIYLRRFPLDAESAMPQNLLMGTTRVLVVESIDQ